MLDRSFVIIWIIVTTSRNEIREISRSYLFRIWIISILSLFSVVNFITTLFTNYNLQSFEKIQGIIHHYTVIPSSIPATITVISTILLSPMVIIMSFQSIHREYVLDTNVIFRVKDYPNLIWIFGHAAGILVTFMTITYINLIPALMYNIFDPDITVNLMEYLIYPIMVSIPAYCFIIGISLFLATFLNNLVFAISFLFLLGTLATVFISKPYCWMFDLFAIKLPILKSEAAGFPDVTRITLSRSIPFLFGISLLSIASLCYKRLFQSNTWKALAIGLTVSGMLTGAGILILQALDTYRSAALRSNLLAADANSADLPAPTMIKCDIKLVHSGDEIRCEVRSIIKNATDQGLKSYLFTLNPGLIVGIISCQGKEIDFIQENHHLIVHPMESLKPGCFDTLSFYYSGTINEEACCLYATELERMGLAYNLDGKLVGIQKRLAVVKDNLMILPFDVFWYPVPGVQYNPSNPCFRRIEYVWYSLNICLANQLTPVSQGRKQIMDDGNIIFTPRYPLEGISLFASKYRHRIIDIDSTTYESYAFNNYDIVEKHFLCLGDTLINLINDIRREKESDYGLSYPFNKFALVEVPAYYSWLQNNCWTGNGLTDQPEIHLITERGFIENGRFTYLKKIYRSYRNIDLTTEKALCSFMLKEILNTTINQIPFYSFSNSFSAPEKEFFGKGVESYIESRVYWTPTDNLTGKHALRSWDYLNMYFQDLTLHKRVNSVIDVDLLTELRLARSVCLFYYLEAIISRNEFSAVFNKFLEENRFKVLSLDYFSDVMNAELGMNLYPIFDQWLNLELLPGFIVSNAFCSIDSGSPFTKVYLEISNGEQTPGVIRISLGSSGNYEYYPVFLGAEETKMVEITCKKCPVKLKIETLLSKNLPSSYTVDVIKGNAQIKYRHERYNNKGRNNIVSDPAIVIVDNEDLGFIVSEPKPATLRKLLASVNKNDEGRYTSFRRNNLPRKWTPTIDYKFFGGYIKSAHFCKAGKGERKVIWNATLTKAGFYDIYVNITDRAANYMNGDFAMSYDNRSYTYRVLHVDGTSEVKINLYEAELGWNLLGRYYLSAGNASVELTNESEYGSVIADAVMWKKMD